MSDMLNTPTGLRSGSMQYQEDLRAAGASAILHRAHLLAEVLEGCRVNACGSPRAASTWRGMQQGQTGPQCSVRFD